MPIEAAPGSVINIFRSGERISALVTSQRPNDSTISIVLLNLRRHNSPSVIYADKWRLDETCLCYDAGIEFELDQNLVDPRGNKWWETPGVMVVIGDQHYIRSSYLDDPFRCPPLVNIQTGDIFNDDQAGGRWTFGGWTLWIKDDLQQRAIKLCDFKAPEPT